MTRELALLLGSLALLLIQIIIWITAEKGKTEQAKISFNSTAFLCLFATCLAIANCYNNYAQTLPSGKIEVRK